MTGEVAVLVPCTHLILDHELFAAPQRHDFTDADNEILGIVNLIAVYSHPVLLEEVLRYQGGGGSTRIGWTLLDADIRGGGPNTGPMLEISVPGRSGYWPSIRESRSSRGTRLCKSFLDRGWSSEGLLSANRRTDYRNCTIRTGRNTRRHRACLP